MASCSINFVWVKINDSRGAISVINLHLPIPSPTDQVEAKGRLIEPDKITINHERSFVNCSH